MDLHSHYASTSTFCLVLCRSWSSAISTIELKLLAPGYCPCFAASSASVFSFSRMVMVVIILDIFHFSLFDNCLLHLGV